MYMFIYTLLEGLCPISLPQARAASTIPATSGNLLSNMSASSSGNLSFPWSGNKSERKIEISTMVGSKPQSYNLHSATLQTLPLSLNDIEQFKYDGIKKTTFVGRKSNHAF